MLLSLFFFLLSIAFFLLARHRANELALCPCYINHFFILLPSPFGEGSGVRLSLSPLRGAGGVLGLGVRLGLGALFFRTAEE